MAVERLTPPSEKRYWEQPRHTTFIAAEVHHAETATILRAVMLGSELLLATRAPHDLILIDGSLAVAEISFLHAAYQAPKSPELRCSHEFLSHFGDYLDAYQDLLRAERSDKNYAALPKYSTRREIGQMMDWPGEHDDRGMLTLLLQAGELTRPLPIEQQDRDPTSPPGRLQAHLHALTSELDSDLRRVHMLYYKPHDWLPALRVEVAHDIAVNPHRLALVVQGLKHQCATGAMLEPYPLYLADRTVKALARAVPAFRQVTTQRLSETYDGDIAEVFLGMHGYRSEIGR